MAVQLVRPDGTESTISSGSVCGDILDHPEYHFRPDSCGEAAIVYKAEDKHSLLGIRYSKTNGFSFEHRAGITGTDSYSESWIIYPDSIEVRPVTVNIGGMPLLLPSSSFVTPSVAHDIVDYFFSTGDRLPTQVWLPTAEIPESLYGG